MLRRLPFLLLPVLLACSKSDSSPVIDFGEGEGITYRDASNLPNGPSDPTDWISDATWNEQERALFSEVSFDLNGSQRPNLVAFASPFPNPSAGQANWTVQCQQASGATPPNCTLRVVFVNRNYGVLHRRGPLTLTGNQSYTFDYAGMGLPVKELSRLYYLAYDNNGLVYKGHGDIRYIQ